LFPLANLGVEHEGRFLAGDVTDAVIEADTRYRPSFLAEDDLFPAKIPLEPLAFAEGYVGAEVFLSSQAQTCWTKPGRPVPASIGDLQARLDPAWRERLAEATRRNVEAAGNDVLVTESLLRGPADCLESVLGAQDLCLALCDRPAWLAEMADWTTERTIELYEAQLAVVPRFHGGTLNRYRIWGPGRNIVTQADIANVMSPAHFRDIFLPSYRRLAGHFDTATIHFHSSAWRHVDALLEIDELAAVEWGMDPNGPTLRDLLPVFARILQSKCVILMNVHRADEVQMLLDHLPHPGLCIILRRSRASQEKGNA
jgi:hypothetical protein